MKKTQKPLCTLCKIDYNKTVREHRKYFVQTKQSERKCFILGKSKVKVSICGTDYYITSEEDELYVRLVADKVESSINAMLKANSRLSVTMAAVMTALDASDSELKAIDSADNLRSQIKDYAEESSRFRMQAEEARRENEQLKREVQSLRTKLAEAELQNQRREPSRQQKPSAPVGSSQKNLPLAPPSQGKNMPFSSQTSLYSRPGSSLSRESEPEEASNFSIPEIKSPFRQSK